MTASAVPTSGSAPLWPWPRVLAHRGGGALAPENTLAAIDVGRAQGHRAVEFDAMLAADDTAWLIHDERLERTTDGRGAVAECRAEQLARLDAGAWFAPRYAGERLARLEQAIAHCRAHGVWTNIEIKPAAGHESRTGERVAQIVAQAYAPPPGAAPLARAALPLLSSFSTAALQAAQRSAPGVPRAHLFERVPADWPQVLAALGCVALHCDHRHLNAALAAAIRRAGYALFCYTVDDPARARQLIGWGVDAFCTDRIDLIGADFA